MCTLQSVDAQAGRAGEVGGCNGDGGVGGVAPDSYWLSDITIGRRAGDKGCSKMHVCPLIKKRVGASVAARVEKSYSGASASGISREKASV